MTVQRPTRGRFITFEGGEGAGKSTQIRLLAQELAAQGIEVVVSREPGGTPAGEEIRRLLVSGESGRWQPLSEALLNYAARFEHVTTLIRPALRRGAWVLCDRFHDSTLAYQGCGQGLNRETVRRLQRLVLGDFTPDLTVILDVPVGVGLQRAQARLDVAAESGGDGAGEDRFERMDMDFHRRLREGFLEIARREPERCAVIDGGGDAEVTHQAVLAVVRRRLGVLAP